MANLKTVLASFGKTIKRIFESNSLAIYITCSLALILMKVFGIITFSWGLVLLPVILPWFIGLVMLIAFAVVMWSIEEYNNRRHYEDED